MFCDSSSLVYFLNLFYSMFDTTEKKTLQKDFQKIVLTLKFYTCSTTCYKIKEAKGKSQHALD